MIDYKNCLVPVANGNYVWVAYQPKPPRLPIATADTAQELADKLGVKRINVESSASKARNGKHKNARYMRVYIGGMEE